MSKKPVEPPSSPLATGAFVVGLMINVFAVFLMSGSLRSFLWEMKTQCFYTEGKCRVVSSRIGRGPDTGDTPGTLPALYVTHQLEVDGKVYPPNENTEELALTANTEEELAPYRARYADGSVHPCWYDASDPGRYSVLVHEGLHPWKTLSYGAIPLPLLGLGCLMMWWAGRSDTKQRKKGTGTFIDT
jgi:hypothetical protein